MTIKHAQAHQVCYFCTFLFKVISSNYHTVSNLAAISAQIQNLFLQQMSAGLLQFSQQESCLWSPWILVHCKHKTIANSSNWTACIHKAKC